MRQRRFRALFLLIALLTSLYGPVQAWPGPAGLPAAAPTALVYVPTPTHGALARFAATGLGAYTRLPGQGLLLSADAAAQQALREAGLAFRVLDPDLSPLLDGRAAERIYVAYPPAALPDGDWADHAPLEASPFPRPDWGRYGRVLLDTGSAVVLRMAPEGAAGLAQAGVAAQPLALVPRPLGSGENGAVPAVIAPDPTVQAMLDQIISPTLYQYVGDLSGEWPALIGGEPFTITTRHTNSGRPIRKATEYAAAHLESLGLAVELHTWSTISNPNVIGEIPGIVNPEHIWIVSAHLDDMPAGPLAPGADDNASGAAAVLAAADVLSRYSWSCTLRFALWTGEEQGLLGSRAYAHRSRLWGEDIRGVVNMDMVAWNTPASTPTMDLHAKSSLTPTLALAQVYSDVIAAYDLDLVPEIVPNGTGASDHASFWLHNYAALLAIEDLGDFNPYYHTTDDQVETLDMAYFTEMARASLGALAHLSGCLITGGLGIADGRVTAAVGGAPIAGATVTFEDAFRNQMPAPTDAAGYYTRTLPVGAYTATAWAYGYLPATAPLTIVTATVTTHDFQLAVAPEYVVSGTVSDAGSGAPLYARITVPGAPIAPTWSDPATGFYSLSLAAGAFAFHVTSTAHLATEQVVVVDGNMTRNFSLTPYACVLLVDDDQNSPNVEGKYTAALDALGVDYDYVNTDNGAPTPYDLAGHRLVVWFTGKLNTETLSAYDEQVLAGYLDDGGRLLLTSQDLLFNRGLNPFARDYLGVASFAGTGQYTLQGTAGHPIGDGLGPYTLQLIPDWSSSAYRPDIVNGAQASPFRWATGHNNSSNYQGAGFRTVFLGWPPELVPNAADRAAVLGRIVNWLGGCGPDGRLAGTVTDAATGTPLEAATVTARPGDWGTTTDPTGGYRLILGTGTYTVTAEKAGYCYQAAVVTVAAGLTTTRDFALAPCEPVTATDFTWTPDVPAVVQPITFTAWSGGWLTRTIDGLDRWVGRYTSLALDSQGRPHISYYDGTDNDLRYARWLPVPSLPITYTWSLGDGSSSLVPCPLPPCSITHTYTLPGAYTVTLTATNACGEAAAAHRVVVVPEAWRAYLPVVRK